MQCLANCTVAGVQLLHHAFNLLAEASLVEIESEYIRAGIEILQARSPDLPSLPPKEPRWSGAQPTTGRKMLEGLQVIIQCLEVTGITCQHQWDQYEIGLVETAVLYALMVSPKRIESFWLVSVAMR